MNTDIQPLLAVLNNAQSANLTAKKARHIQTKNGHQITGVVLCHPETGERCIVDMATCKWFSKKDFDIMMHDTQT
jgi:hypothetical protein